VVDELEPLLTRYSGKPVEVMPGRYGLVVAVEAPYANFVLRARILMVFGRLRYRLRSLS
jgi:hypothetical protein